ncbi:MAG: YceI family protein [Chloroflexi bacterium]|nr:YceI family protein [Chloroflexota bacterium]
MTWEIDPSHTTAQFAVKHMMVATVRGHFQTVQGTLELDEANPARSSVDVAIDVATIDTRDPKRDAHLRSADFFDVENHPSITFKSTRVEKSGGSDRYRVVGDLTIRGTTREVALDAEVAGKAKDPWGGVRAGFTAQTAISRQDFGLVWNVPLEAGGWLVGDDVKITLDVEAFLKA